MKILFVSPFPPARDGIGKYTSILSAALQARACEVRVILPRAASEQAPEVAGAIHWLAWREGEMRRQVAQFAPDVIHVQFAVPAFGPRTLLVARRIRALRSSLRVPVVVTMHEVTRDTALLRGLGRAIYRGIVRTCDLAIVHTEAARTVLVDSLGMPAHSVAVIPHPAAQPPPADSQAGDLRERFGLGEAPVLLAFGFVHVHKGMQDLVAALSRLRAAQSAAWPKIQVVVAGSVRRRHGPFRLFEARDYLHLWRVLLLARRLGVRDRITLTGYVPETEIRPWFGAAEAVILPYRRTEQSGVAALASALGVPVLASRVGGLDEQFGGSPWTFPPRDSAALAEVIAAFLAAPADRRPTAALARDSADVAAVAAATLDAYRIAALGPAGGLAHVA